MVRDDLLSCCVCTQVISLYSGHVSETVNDWKEHTV